MSRQTEVVGAIPAPRGRQQRVRVPTALTNTESISRQRSSEFADSCSVTPAICSLPDGIPGMAGCNNERPNGSRSRLEYLLTGRNVGLPGPQTITGPCAGFLPFRVPVKHGAGAAVKSVQAYLQRTQNHFWEATEHSNVGLGNPRRASSQELRNTSLFLF